MRLGRLLLSLVISAAACAQTPAPQAGPKPAPVRETVNVTATDRGLAGLNDQATSVVVLDQQQLQQQPGLTLDDSLHAVAGFQLYRRTSSWTANPTTEGVSLRGLGSTAASRSLVVSDEVPLNDAFGGWVHWDEVPSLAINSVEVLRGGASDLYGSSAIGGVIDVVPVRPAADLHVAADALGATENSGVGDALISGGTGRLQALGAISVLDTGGYIAIAPAVRGPVDIPSNVSSRAGRLELDGGTAHNVTAFLRGNFLGEERSNGTPMQVNSTRLWRYAAGADAERAHSALTARLFGSRETYEQSFSSVTSVATNRDSERLTTVQHVPTNELGLVLQASHAFAHSFTAALGFDVRDVRGTDAESPTYSTAPNPSLVLTSARQRAVGGFADALWQAGKWSASASIRVDSFRTFDARQFAPGPQASLLPVVADIVASPRVGLVRQLPHGVALTATAFRAFRGPTMNELFRTSQVGAQKTLANSSLVAERATGFEAGADITRSTLGHVRATYFWTEVNRPISAVLLSTNLYQRQNLGQLRSRGLMVEAQLTPYRGFDATFGYQYAVATVTAFNSSSAAQANLTGRWLPEVPRHSVTATANYAVPRVAAFHLIASYEGREFDDAANTFLLHPYARFDLSADRKLTHGFSLYAGAENLLNRAIDAGRTPILTLAAPRLVEGGLRYSFTR